MNRDINRVFLSRDQIAEKVTELGGQIRRDYEGKNPLFVGILRGSFVFLADLVRASNIECTVDFMSVSSYGNQSVTTGAVRITKDLDYDIEARHVIIVEDIVDTGLTVHYISGILEKKKPASVKVCALLDKPSRRKIELAPDYRGFEIPDEFVVGYGLDYAGRFRHLPDICIPEDSVLTGQYSL